MTKVRIYGKVMTEWSETVNFTDKSPLVVILQQEIAYKEYDADTAELVGVGTEDFSWERKCKELDHGWAYTWDGQRLNKGGYRWCEDRGVVQYRKCEKKAVKRFLRAKYNAAEAQLRK